MNVLIILERDEVIIEWLDHNNLLTSHRVIDFKYIKYAPKEPPK